MKKYSFLCIALILCGLMISCASSPEKKDLKDGKKASTPPSEEYAEAKLLREKIRNHNLDQYAPEEYKNGEKEYAEGEQYYTKNNSKSKKAFEEATRFFDAVIKKGYPAYAKGLGNEVAAIKKEADENKASVAMKQEYAEALETYEQGLREQEAGNHEKAVSLLEKAKSLFEEVRKQTLVKKQRAEQSIERSKSELQQVEQKVEAAGL